MCLCVAVYREWKNVLYVYFERRMGKLVMSSTVVECRCSFLLRVQQLDILDVPRPWLTLHSHRRQQVAHVIAPDLSARMDRREVTYHRLNPFPHPPRTSDAIRGRSNSSTSPPPLRPQLRSRSRKRSVGRTSRRMLEQTSTCVSS